VTVTVSSEYTPHVKFFGSLPGLERESPTRSALWECDRLELTSSDKDYRFTSRKTYGMPTSNSCHRKKTRK